jgi:hypothetical protein
MVRLKSLTAMGWLLLGIALMSQLIAFAFSIESDPKRLEAIRKVTEWLYFVSLLSTLLLSMLFAALVKTK